VGDDANQDVELICAIALLYKLLNRQQEINLSISRTYNKHVHHLAECQLKTPDPEWMTTSMET